MDSSTSFLFWRFYGKAWHSEICICASLVKVLFNFFLPKKCLLLLGSIFLGPCLPLFSDLLYLRWLVFDPWPPSKMEVHSTIYESKTLKFWWTKPCFERIHGLLVSVFDKVYRQTLSRLTAQYLSCNLKNAIFFRKAQIVQKRKEQVIYLILKIHQFKDRISFSGEADFGHFWWSIFREVRCICVNASWRFDEIIELIWENQKKRRQRTISLQNTC